MQIDITKLKSGYENSVTFAQTHTFSKDELAGTELSDLKEIGRAHV